MRARPPLGPEAELGGGWALPLWLKKKVKAITAYVQAGDRGAAAQHCPEALGVTPLPTRVSVTTGSLDILVPTPETQLLRPEAGGALSTCKNKACRPAVAVLPAAAPQPACAPHCRDLSPVPSQPCACPTRTCCTGGKPRSRGSTLRPRCAAGCPIQARAP